MTECKHCQKPMLERVYFGRPVVYCSEACKRKYQTASQRRPPPPRDCVICGKTFATSQAKAKTCSKECRKVHQAATLAAWLEAHPGHYSAANARAYDRRRKAEGHEQPKRLPRVQWLTGSCKWCGDDIKVHPTIEPKRMYCNVTCMRDDRAYAKEIKESQ
jgi:hypothetical protein